MVVKDRIARYLAHPLRLTLWTWIKYCERSKEPKHCKRVKANMINALNVMVQQGTVATCRSVRGKRAYRSIDGDCPF